MKVISCASLLEFSELYLRLFLNPGDFLFLGENPCNFLVVMGTRFGESSFGC